MLGRCTFKTVSTQSVTNLNIARTDKQVIYDFIISEMADAADTGLKSAADLAYKPGRISQSTAWGMLARVYLFRAGEHYREKETPHRQKQKTTLRKPVSMHRKLERQDTNLPLITGIILLTYVQINIILLLMKVSGKQNLPETIPRIHKPKVVSVI